uniref:MADS-box domain-containing protein n=1 Tax=Megaselia scalaris TaxID=36166 RepID=T1GMS8_MEGSC
MDPSRGDSRYNLNYSMNSIGLSLADQADLYGNPAATAALISRPPSSGLLQPMIGGGGGGGAGRNSAGLGQMSNSNQCQTLNNTSAGQQQARGIKRTSSDCYEDQQQQIHRSSNPSGMTTLQGLESVGGGGGAGGNGTNSGQADVSEESYTSLANKKSPPANGKKTKGRVKIKMEYIDNKLRRYTTFSKRKTGIMKKVSIL